MTEMIQGRRNSETKEIQHDLLSNLLDTNDDFEGYSKLSDREVLGKMVATVVYPDES